MKPRTVLILFMLGLVAVVLIVFNPWASSPVPLDPEAVTAAVSISLSGTALSGTNTEGDFLLAISEDTESGTIGHLFVMHGAVPEGWSDFPAGSLTNAKVAYSGRSISIQAERQPLLTAGIDAKEHPLLILSHYFGDLGKKPSEILKSAQQGRYLQQAPRSNVPPAARDQSRVPS